MFDSRKYDKLILSLLLFAAFVPQVVCAKVLVNPQQENVLEGDITIMVYPDGSMDVCVVGSSEQALDPWASPPPFRDVAFELVNSLIDINLTEISSTLIVELRPDTAEELTDLDLDVTVHFEAQSAEATIFFDLPGYVGVEGRIGFVTDEATSESTLDLDATVRIWYTQYPREYIELFIENFPLLREQMLSELSRMTDGRLEVQEMTIVDSEVGPEMATIAFRAVIVGDFAEGLRSLAEEAYIPYLGMPDATPRIDFKEAMMTNVESVDIEISFDGEERAFIISFDGVVEGDLDRQVNVIKNLLIEEGMRESTPDPETAEMINEFLLPTELSVLELNATFGYWLLDEAHGFEFAVRGLVMRPPTAEALLKALQKASEEASQPGFTLTLEGGSDDNRYVEIVVPPTASEPLVKEPRKVVWAFDDIESLDQVTFEVKELKGPSMLTPQVLIPAAGVAVAIAVAILILARR